MRLPVQWRIGLNRIIDCINDCRFLEGGTSNVTTIGPRHFTSGSTHVLIVRGRRRFQPSRSIPAFQTVRNTGVVTTGRRPNILSDKLKILKSLQHDIPTTMRIE
jgi:hypothetical protein